jgi:hypothetical protein
MAATEALTAWAFGPIEPGVSVPTVVLLMVLGGMVAGAVAGGATAGRFDPERGTRIAAFVGSWFTIGHLANISMIPHPIWFAVVGLFAFVPPAVIAARAAARGGTAR